MMYVGMGVGGVESGGSGSIGVGGWRDGWMSGMGEHGNQFASLVMIC